MGSGATEARGGGGSGEAPQKEPARLRRSLTFADAIASDEPPASAVAPVHEHADEVVHASDGEVGEVAPANVALRAAAGDAGDASGARRA